jgi:vacuolar iron transporter family protein
LYCPPFPRFAVEINEKISGAISMGLGGFLAAQSEAEVITHY